ncbi:MAG: DUF4238 domain-containing protein [Caedimonas sp.]|nr:DUF4238 domain-containing protein [Caedimonas sp.]
MKKNHTKRNHFLPILYLKGFENKKAELWCYDKQNHKTYCGTSKSLGLENKLYHPEPPASPNKYEDFLSNKVESPAAPILEELRNKNFPADEEKRQSLALFFVSLLERTPSSIDHSQKQSNDEMSLIAQQLVRKPYGAIEKRFFSEEDYKELRKNVLNGKIKISSTRDFVLYNMWLRLGCSFFIARMRWVLVESSSEDFITSDNLSTIYTPYYNGGFYGVGFVTAGSRVFIPLSGRLLLMIANDEKYEDGEIYDINTSGVSKEEFNETIIARNILAFDLAQRFVYGGSDLSLIGIAKCYESYEQELASLIQGTERAKDMRL